MNPQSSEAKGSKAFQLYIENYERLVAIANSYARDLHEQAGAIDAGFNSLQASTREWIKTYETSTNRTIDGLLAIQSDQIEPLKELAATTQAHQLFIYDWLTVMMVTFAEVYIENAFNILLSNGLSSANLPKQLAEQMKKTWITHIIRTGNPQNWVDKLEMLGVTGYGKGIGLKMEGIWTRRKNTVHKSNPQKLDTAEFFANLKLVHSFVGVTDDFVARSVPITLSHD